MLVPIFILIAGIGNTMKVLVIVSGCLWPILLNTVEGVRGRDEVLSDTCRAYGIRGPARLRHLVLRSASPQIVTGMRQALSIGIILMVISEMFAATSGLGFTIVQFQRGFAIPRCGAGSCSWACSGWPCRWPSGWSSGCWPGTTACAAPSGAELEDPPAMSKTLQVRGLNKVYEGPGRSVEALATSPSPSRPASWSAWSARRAAARRPCCGAWPGCWSRPPARCCSRATGGRPPPGMAVVFQDYGRSLFPWMTVRANVELPLRPRAGRDRRDELVGEALEAVGLGDVHGAYPWQLSGGMQQRWPSPARWPTSRTSC